jgi:antitoxin (DNA-binding transcriptional repressor) of toxin-antitoxin stability system
MIYNMIKLNIYEAKTHLSRYLAKLRLRETILLCKRNQPVARFVPYRLVALRNVLLDLRRGNSLYPRSSSIPFPKSLSKRFRVRLGEDIARHLHVYLANHGR